MKMIAFTLASLLALSGAEVAGAEFGYRDVKEIQKLDLSASAAVEGVPVVALAAEGAGSAPPAMMMYRFSAHFYLTAFLARRIGYGNTAADTVASYVQYTDDDPETEPDSFFFDATPLALLAPFAARGKYHFADAGQIEALRRLAFSEENHGRLKPFGRYLHALQDWHAHARWERRNGKLIRKAGFEPILGHAALGAAPDIPCLPIGRDIGDRAEDRIEVAMMMAQATFDALRDYLALWRPYTVTHAGFDDVRGVVKRAMHLQIGAVEIKLDDKTEARIDNEAWRVFTSEHGGMDLVEMRRRLHPPRRADEDYQRTVERIRKREMESRREPAYHGEVGRVLFPDGDLPVYKGYTEKL